MSATLPQRLVLASSPITLDLEAGVSLRGQARLAALDILDGLRLWRLAWTLGWLDIKLRYRGSLLGPFWLTLSTGVMVGCLGVLYSTLFVTDIKGYVPFLALSQVLWMFLSTVVTEACLCFTGTDSVIRSARMPFSVQALRTIVRNVLVFGHNVVVIVAVFAVFRIWPGARMVWALPGLAVWVIDGFAVCLLLGAFCARFRDISPIVGSVMQIAFFVTPIIWQPQQLGANQHLLVYSPFFDLLELVREPLLGSAAGVHVWVAALLFSVALCAVTFALFMRARGRIAFWM